MVWDVLSKKKKETFFILVVSVTVLLFVYVDELTSKTFDPGDKAISVPFSHKKDLISREPSMRNQGDNRAPTLIPTTSQVQSTDSSTEQRPTVLTTVSTPSDIQKPQNIPDNPADHLSNDLNKNRNSSTKTLNSRLITSRKSLNLKPPSQQWARAQFYKTIEFLNWTYPTTNHWDQCSIRTYYFSNLQTIFTGTPKTGCSNWLIALLNAEGVLNKKIDPTKIKFVHGGLTVHRRVRALLQNNLVTKAELDKAFSFAVVRNPWTRMVSGYRDKLSSEITQGGSFRGVGMGIVAWSRNISDSKLLQNLYPTFEEYARWLVYKNGKLDAHFGLQIGTLCIPKAMYDYIVPLEHSAQLSKEVWSKINAADIPLLGSYDRSSDPRKQKSALLARQWLSQLPSIIVDKLYRIYEADFILLNYSNFTHPDFPLPLHN